MTKHQSSIKYKNGRKLLFESSYGAIPFNIFLSVLLAIYLFNSSVPDLYIYIWVGTMFALSIIRMLQSKLVIKRKLYIHLNSMHLHAFILLCFLTGLAWNGIYFISLQYAEYYKQIIILLVFGGMSAGATASLAVYLPAYFAYILSIFIPVIIYNIMLWTFEAWILATIFIFYLIGITIVANINNKLLQKLFFLSEQNKELVKKLGTLSVTDSLTGIHNRRTYTKTLQSQISIAKRNGHDLSLLYIDVDNFKFINDTLGHSYGDKFIKYCAKFLQNHFQRANDFLFRIGGDEFVIIVVNLSRSQVLEMCEKLIKEFKIYPEFLFDNSIPDAHNILSKVSISIGVAFVPHTAKLIKVENVIEKSDQALYMAKDNGKNSIQIFDCI